MSKLGKTILIGFIVIIIGVVVMLTALGLSDWSLDGDYEAKEFVCDIPISKLAIDIGVGDLDIKYYDGEFVKVEYQDSKSLQTSILQFGFDDVKDNNLQIQNKMHFRLFNFGRWLKKAPKMTIYIPNSTQVDLQCKVNAGVANVDSGKFGNVSCILNAGTLNLEDIESKLFYVKLNAGSVKVQNLVATETTFIVNAGDFKIAKLACDETKLDLNAGKFLVNDMTCNVNTIEINSGTCKFEKIYLDKLDLNLNSGNFVMNVQGAKSEFNIDVEKHTGNCNISNQTGTNPDKMIKTEIHSGNVTVQFEN